MAFLVGMYPVLIPNSTQAWIAAVSPLKGEAVLTQQSPMAEDIKVVVESDPGIANVNEQKDQN